MLKASTHPWALGLYGLDFICFTSGWFKINSSISLFTNSFPLSVYKILGMPYDPKNFVILSTIIDAYLLEIT